MIRTVHVGVRGRGAWALELMAADHRFEPVAVVSRHPAGLEAERRPGSSAARPLRNAFTSLEQALDAVECDAVVVSTPVELHARDLRTAFAAGKHVLVEKCLTNRWDQACELVGHARQAGVQLVVAQNYRFSARTQTLHAALARGALGPPMLVDLQTHKFRPAPRQQNYPLAMVWDHGCHDMDDLQWCIGPIAEVTASTFSAPWSRYRDDAGIQALLRFRSGAVCTYVLSNLARMHQYRCSVHTERGALVWSGSCWEWHASAASEDDAFGRNEPPVRVPVPEGIPDPPERAVVDAFHLAVTSGSPTPISGRANLETLRACEMLRLAVAEGRPIRRDEVTGGGTPDH